MRYIMIAISTFLTVAIVCGAPVIALAQQSPTYGPHMWNGGWWMFAGPMTMILFFGAIIVLVVLFVRWLDGSGRHTSSPSSHNAPLDILKQRFARGEIDKAEFEERRKVLEE